MLTTPLLGPALTFDHLNDQGNGTFTASLADGTVVSIQPDGSRQTRSAGTAGPYEIFTLNGTPQTATVMAFAPQGVPILFPFVPQVVNS